MKINPQAAVIFITPTNTPPLSQKGQALLYFKDKLMISQDGQPYEELMSPKTKVIKTQNWTLSNKYFTDSKCPEQVTAMHIDETITDAIFTTTGCSEFILTCTLKLGSSTLATHIHDSATTTTQQTTVQIPANSLLELFCESEFGVLWSGTLKAQTTYEI